MYERKKDSLIHNIEYFLEGLNYTDEKIKNMLEAMKLYLDGNEIIEIAAKMGKSRNTIKGYFSEIKKCVPENEIDISEKIHISNRFANKDNLFAFIKDCYEKGLPISDIPIPLGYYCADARMIYKELGKTESKVIRDRCLKLKGIPAEFEDIGFFYIMGRYKISLGKMFNINASEMNKVKKYLDSQNIKVLGQGALDNVYERVDNLSTNPFYKDWLKVMEMYHMGNSPEKIKESGQTKFTLSEIKKFIKMYENNRVFEALPRANVILDYLSDFIKKEIL